jgi:hypothetical protein
MTVYQTAGPDASGQYLIGYPTPGVPHVFTAAGAAPSHRLAAEECARLNEVQVADRRAALARKASTIILDQEH